MFLVRPPGVLVSGTLFFNNQIKVNLCSHNFALFLSSIKQHRMFVVIHVEGFNIKFAFLIRLTMFPF